MANPSAGGWNLHEAGGAPVGFLRFRGAVGKGEMLRIGTVPEWRGLEPTVARGTPGQRGGAMPLPRLYRSAGFASAGMRPAYHANPPEDARVLQWHAAADGR